MVTVSVDVDCLRILLTPGGQATRAPRGGIDGKNRTRNRVEMAQKGLSMVVMSCTRVGSGVKHQYVQVSNEIVIIILTAKSIRSIRILRILFGYFDFVSRFGSDTTKSCIHARIPDTGVYQCVTRVTGVTIETVIYIQYL